MGPRLLAEEGSALAVTLRRTATLQWGLGFLAEEGTDVGDWKT